MAKGVVDWNEENVALLHRYWFVEGKSARECAALIPGATKSGIIGKVYRQNWPKRQGQGQGQLLRKAAQAPKPLPKPFLHPRGPTPPVSPYAIRQVNPTNSNPKPWTERLANECAHPVDRDGESEQYSCCAPTHGKLYCAAHAQIMYVESRSSQEEFERGLRRYVR